MVCCAFAVDVAMIGDGVYRCGGSGRHCNVQRVRMGTGTVGDWLARLNPTGGGAAGAGAVACARRSIDRSVKIHELISN